jgi:hypothetical protein
MATFAERIGKRAPRTIVQTDALDAETRTELWNVLVVLQDIFERARERDYNGTVEAQVVDAIWTQEFKEPRDEMPSRAFVWQRVKTLLLEGEWFDALDLIEALVRYIGRYEDWTTADLQTAMRDAFNERFERYLLGYRFVGGEITPIATSAEAAAVDEAIAAVTPIAGARHALERATELLADREHPDYPNSIKESISAVESVVTYLTGKGELGKGLGLLESAGIRIHPALKGAWLKMYGWASDDDGIRHGSIEAADADQALARYVLVTSSAFVSYLIEERSKAGELAAE